ncbi:protein of unknown function [uncultured Woeseiaceae bacterium]|uniref:non-specific serine/threonine protein kinase n=1 Tax=uncultured Woeseiaceae bacterium TaxID=1983305 RepID=A0A7D9D0Z7_9GAMM|nr:protein of unknown function [uncultured Woeseiaceae bacterium]
MARDKAYRKAEEAIEEAYRSRATALDLQEIRGLTELPKSLTKLTLLDQLIIDVENFETFPELIGQLSGLTMLYIVSGNFASVPECIKQLTGLERLMSYKGRLETVPDWIHNLTELRDLDFDKNEIRHLPVSLCQLEHLNGLNLDNNPLNPELASAHEKGLDSVRIYLRELIKGSRKRFESKLLILGDGNEGKTCVSRALRGLRFKKQSTTRGVDVVPWVISHPDDPKDEDMRITLNIWDFEGQEINHQTHQFFLTSDSLYLLVFKCRDQFLLERAEYWLDTIRARAPQAKVVMVVTECEERTPYVPEDRLRANYTDLLGDEEWLFAVGCADNTGVAQLQEALTRRAAALEFMGRDWPDSYARAEKTILETAEKELAYIDRGKLHDLLIEADIDSGSFDDVTMSMATLGTLTQFPDCPALHDFIVLQPQWLTKAISEIMEDGQLAKDRGEILLSRMRDIWDEKGYEGLLPTFHNCMKEFELCYDLDDPDHHCLVPLRFGYIKPKIPWSVDVNGKERHVSYKLNIRPPLGLMSRLIVKTHHMIVKSDERPNGVYWHNGVFLQSGEESLRSEALCEFDNDERTLNITVRAAFPQNMIEQIHAYVSAVFSFFNGLNPERSYGCIRVEDDSKTESQCHGVHSENKIAFALESREKVACEHGRHHIDPIQLVMGISSFGDHVRQIFREEMDKPPTWAEPVIQDISKLMDWTKQNSQLLEQVREGQAALTPEMTQELELKLREYLMYFSQLLDDRDFTSAPGIISFNTVDRSLWNPTTYFEKSYVLILYCECEHDIHPCLDARVEFSKDRDWWIKTAPWIARATKVLSAGLQLAFAGMPLAMRAQDFDVIKNDVNFMNALSKHVELEVEVGSERVAGIAEQLEHDSLSDLRSDEKDARLMRTAVASFLDGVAPNNYRAKQWGSLRRVHMPNNSYRWLCKDHR